VSEALDKAREALRDELWLELGRVVQANGLRMVVGSAESGGFLEVFDRQSNVYGRLDAGWGSTFYDAVEPVLCQVEAKLIERGLTTAPPR
jgi:hypothetical protein